MNAHSIIAVATFPLNAEPSADSSTAGKRNFAGRDKGAETAPEGQGDHCRDMTHAKQSRQFGATCPELGKSPLARKCVVADAVRVEPVSATTQKRRCGC